MDGQTDGRTDHWTQMRTSGDVEGWERTYLPYFSPFQRNWKFLFGQEGFSGLDKRDFGLS